MGGDPGNPAQGDDAAWAPTPPPSTAPAAPQPPPPPAPPPPQASADSTADQSTILPGYRDFVQIARGGDSIVYRARQESIDRDVAVKVVLLDDAETRARFERELQITVALGRQHPHIVTVLATGTTRGGERCLVMDYFEQGSLHDRLSQRGPLPVADVRAAGSVVADALSFAHHQGVLHRDVKPQNVLVLPTSYVLADFGLARAIDSGHSASLERFSYRHASPQVLDGDPPTVSDDVYSLGSTLYTLLDGRPPFAATDPGEDSALSYLRRARTTRPRPLIRADVPVLLVDIVMRCLAKAREDRFASVDELRAALDALPLEDALWAPGVRPDSRPPAVVAPPAPSAEDAMFAPDAGRADAPTTMDRSVPTPPAAAPPVQAPVSARHTEAPPSGTAVEIPAIDAAPIKPPSIRTPPDAAPPIASPPTEAPKALPEPEPVAVSALAQLDPLPQRHFRDDSDLTGLRPMEPQPPAPQLPRRWPLYASIVAVALVAGVLVGFWRTGGGPDRNAANSPSAGLTLSTGGPSVAVPVPTISGQTAGTGQIDVDASITPKITGVTRRNGAVVISFTDPTKGTATFVVTGDKFVGQADPGAHGVTIPDQPAGKRCYGITAWLGGSSGFTHSSTVQACTTS